MNVYFFCKKHNPVIYFENARALKIIKTSLYNKAKEKINIKFKEALTYFKKIIDLGAPMF